MKIYKFMANINKDDVAFFFFFKLIRQIKDKEI